MFGLNVLEWNFFFALWILFRLKLQLFIILVYILCNTIRIKLNNLKRHMSCLRSFDKVFTVIHRAPHFFPIVIRNYTIFVTFKYVFPRLLINNKYFTLKMHFLWFINKWTCNRCVLCVNCGISLKKQFHVGGKLHNHQTF